MGSSRLSMKRLLLLSVLLTLALFSAVGSAQRQTSDNQDATNTNNNNQPTQTNDATSTQDQTSDRATQRTTEKTSDRTTERTTQQTSQTTDAPKTTSTNDATTTSSQSLPDISSSTSSSSGKFTLPSLTRATGTAIPTYPPPSPPPTHNAPFMNRSTMPDGTVFIAVGAILGAFGAAVLIWRGVVACLLHRSVKKAAMAQHTATNDKATAFPAPPAPFYKYTDRDSSSPSLALAGAAGRGQRRTNRGPIPSGTPSQSNLFFSPTAASGTAGSGVGGGGGGGSNRDSRFLPSGFYAATSASPNPAGGGGGGHHAHSISMSNLRPSSRGHPGAGPGPGFGPPGFAPGGFGPGSSPPESPNLPPRGLGTPRNFSTSSFNLNHAPSDRTPSAFLDDLLDEQPGAFPPGPSARNSYGPPGQGRH